MASQRRSLPRTSLCDRPRRSRRIRSSSFNRHVPRACADIRPCRFFRELTVRQSPPDKARLQTKEVENRKSGATEDSEIVDANRSPSTTK